MPERFLACGASTPGLKPHFLGPWSHIWVGHLHFGESAFKTLAGLVESRLRCFILRIGRLMPAAKRANTDRPRSEPRLSRLRRPQGMSVEDWQIRLRRQFGREQPFVLENLGAEPVFSEFAVTGPISSFRCPNPKPCNAWPTR
jgi:hypothetical protein